MIIKSLVENTVSSNEYEEEHGLSLYIETLKHKLLFDVGQSDKFIKNALKMGIDLSTVDTVIISHGHYDHGGGLSHFFKINNTANIYINKNAFKDFYAEDGEYIGLNKDLLAENRIIFTDDECIIDDELYTFTGNKNTRNNYMDTFGLYVKEPNQFIPDKFLHEQYLIINENNNKVLFGGCCHKGILNIMDWVKNKDIKTVIGGFHFMDINVTQEVDYLYNVARKLKSHECSYYTCHCTGIDKHNFLKGEMNDKINYISTGQTISI